MHYELETVPVSEVVEPKPQPAAISASLMGCVIVLIILAVLAVVAAIAIPNILSAMNESKKTADIMNLKGLVESYVTGQAMNRPRPTTEGWRFWIALYVGDGEGDDRAYLVENEDQAYLTPAEAGLLISPADPVPDRENLTIGLYDSFGATGAQAANSSWLSYAGPRSAREFHRRGSVVGATGTRDGVPLFSDGFSMVYSNGTAEFVGFNDMQEQYGWPNGWPDFSDPNGPLAGVQNIEE